MRESITVRFSDIAKACDYIGEWIDGDWIVVEREWFSTGWQATKLTPSLRRRLEDQAGHLWPVEIVAA